MSEIGNGRNNLSFIFFEEFALVLELLIVIFFFISSTILKLATNVYFCSFTTLKLQFCYLFLSKCKRVVTDLFFFCRYLDLNEIQDLPAGVFSHLSSLKEL